MLASKVENIKIVIAQFKLDNLPGEEFSFFLFFGLLGSVYLPPLPLVVVRCRWSYSRCCANSQSTEHRLGPKLPQEIAPGFVMKTKRPAMSGDPPGDGSGQYVRVPVYLVSCGSNELWIPRGSEWKVCLSPDHLHNIKSIFEQCGWW